MTSHNTPSDRPEPVAPLDITSRRRHADPVPTRRRTGRAGDLVVACILDDFSFAAFSGEADLAPLTMNNWHIELIAAQPDLLLVESAWRGHRQKWWNTVHHHGPELTGIIEWCRDRGIPTAFWNKEDPVHFNTFLTTAGMFDAVFTTDLDCVPQYKRELGHENVHFLPFAAQTAHSNPLEVFDRVEACAFAGAYYEKYPERLADLAELSTELSAGDRRFDIYDRNHGTDTPGYMFPEEYQPYIVGGALSPDMLDIPYKGYTANLNLNSVKQSQSMFARRVFELMASNTLVISNFSRGLRLTFGDLAITTDSGDEVRRRLGALRDTPNGVARLRAMALRKVLREHTYTERLEYIAAKAGARLSENLAFIPLLFTNDSNSEDVQYCINAMQAQTHQAWTLIHRCPDMEPADPRIRYLATERPPVAYAHDFGHSHIGIISSADYYGPHYLEDLVAALRIFDVQAVGHADTGADEGPTPSWIMTRGLPLRGALLSTSAAEDSKTTPDPADLDEQSRVDGLAVGTFEYLKDGRNVDASTRALVEPLPVKQGLTLDALRTWADELELPEESGHPLPETSPGDILADLPERQYFSISKSEDGIRITSTLDAGMHDYWIAPGFHTVPEGDAGKEATLHVDATPGLNLSLVAYFFDSKKERIGHSIAPARMNHSYAIPPGTATLKWGLRVSGPGTATIRRVIHEAYTAPQPALIPSSNTIAISPIYPSYENLYRNAFVHSRFKSYRSLGLNVEVFTPRDTSDISFREFQDIDASSIGFDTLATILRQRQNATLLIHNLNPKTWHALRNSGHSGPVIVWVHGFEIQPWWRRKFNFTTDEELAAGKAASDERVAFWRQVFDLAPSSMHFVFVSKNFAEETFEDLNVRLPAEKYSVIHNPIDTELFKYVPKSAESRFNILSIRPYHSPVYANDLAVKAVLELSKHSIFPQLKFDFFGDGPLFEEITQPIEAFSNVTLHRRFLTHREIASVHRESGIFLVPTRSDTQGVSRDEAMSSGLVPITSNVAAIPEFVDDSSGIICDPENAAQLAEGVLRLLGDGQLFQTLSAAAAQRVRQQSSQAVVVRQEIQLIQWLEGSSLRR